MRGGVTAAGLALGLMAVAGPAAAVTLAVCRLLDAGGAPTSSLAVPAGSLFRDNGRADDPLAEFTGDRWQLRLETIAPAVIAPLQTCVVVPARVTSDSSVKSVTRFDNRIFVYAGSSDLISPAPSEALLTLRAAVMDQGT
jgi:hypothetical protein